MGLKGNKGDTGDIGPIGPKGDTPSYFSIGPSFFPPVKSQVCGNGFDWDGIEALEGANKTGNTYYVGVNIPNPITFITIPAINSFTQSIAEYTYSGISPITLSNFNITATLNGKPALVDVVGYTYYLLINNIVQSTVALTGNISPQSGNNPISFVVYPGDKIVIKAVLNLGAKKADDPDDIIFEWCVDLNYTDQNEK